MFSFAVIFSQGNFANPQFFNAITWLKNSTPRNSTVLTVWSEGSVVEGFGNRTSYTDSVDTGQNATKIYAFSRFLFTNEYNFSYLSEVSPNYLLLRSYFLGSAQPLEVEGGLSNVALNKTNLYLLLNNSNSTIIGNSATLIKVYTNNDTTIYKVIPTP